MNNKGTANFPIASIPILDSFVLTALEITIATTSDEEKNIFPSLIIFFTPTPIFFHQ